ncbi:IclR family transcriptional regulator domain-containing protein [Pseudonocardia acaciae]|uniref:IclR family transcriptional regulator domain-containing protein n=1 Tax=Pseudonocardia acaciae TaxID=551276 RepID=UPI0004918890|nr:helix-turn-helix domain-containing protein [Pseudonocardia acaciae]
MARLADGDSAVRQRRQLSGAAAADFSEALARGLAVLSAFDSEHQRLTQADLARELGLSRATVRRAVLTLEHLGYLVADGRLYRLSPRVLELAASYLTSNAVSAVVQPVCDRICARLRESCTVAVLDGAEVVMVARAVPQRLIAVGAGIGYRVPMVPSALGKVLLAHLGPEERAARLAAVDIPDAPGAPDEDTFDGIRRDGYCYVANDVEVGFHSVAVPLRRWDGTLVAAMNVGCGTERIGPELMRTEIADLLRTSAEELRARLI